MNTDQVIENLKVQLQACKETNRESIERILELEEKLDRINEGRCGCALRPLGTTGDYTDSMGNVYKRE